MAVKDVFSVQLVTDSGYEDITSGILNVDITHGTEVYEGPYQQIDTGLFTIVSRNPLIDPNVNSNIVEGAEIEFRDSRNVEAGKTNAFFIGYITDIDVQYQREDDPIITITGTDLFGLLQRTVVSEDLRLAGLNYVSGISPTDPDYNGPSLNYLVNTEQWYQNSPASINIIDIAAIPGAINPALPYDNYLGYAPARYLPDRGETLLEVLNNYTQTNLNYCSINFRQTPGMIDVYPYAKYNSFFWPPIQDPALEFPTYNFSSDPADGRPYETILLNNGYNRRTKTLDISNETKFAIGLYPNSTIESETTTYPPFKVNENSVEVATKLDTIFSTSFIDNDAINIYVTDIFQVVNFGSDEIQQITFDNARKEDIDNDYTYSFSQLNQFIRIKHKLNNTQTIDRFYDIAGITHSISPDKWEMGFTFKPSQNEIAFSYQGQLPTIQMNSLTGDSNFNFTATITDFPTEDIDKVIWCLNGTNSDVTEQWFYTVGAERYKDGIQRNGLTQTWNFDDDGILAGPDFPTGGYGSGEWYVIPYIILKNGWVIAPYVKLTVGTPAVDADFLWNQNLTNNFGQVTFTDDSHNNEIGEPDSYLWNFGDGTTSTLKNPVKVYDPAPSTTTYNVSLTVFAYGVGGTKVYNTRTKTVTLVQPTMAPNFTWVANAQVVTFTNTSTNVGFEEPDAYLWEFGDGTTSTQKNPVHTFPVTDVNTPQSFSVKLTTRNIWEQTANITKTVTTTALNKSGTLPIDTLRLRFEPYLVGAGLTTPSPLYFYIFDLKARTSNTKANLTYLRPTTRIYPGYITWYEADGTTAESSDPLNLTRDSSITSNDQYGLSPFRTNTSTSATLDFKLDTTLPVESRNLINDILLTFRDVGTVNNILYPIAPTKKLFVDVPDSFGGWVNIGYYQILDSKVKPAGVPIGVVTQDTKTMTSLRPMPMNIPYFKYTFNNTVASFTSMETGVSYAWNFGDGTTSTLKDPVKTFPRRGTYNVSLTVTFASGATRTTTEPVIVEYIAPYAVRYFKFVQNLHTGTHAFDTPYLNSVYFKQDNVDPSNSGLTFAKTDIYPNEYRVGTDGATVINPLVSPNNNRLTQGGGFRVKSLDASNRTQWEMIADMGSAQNNLTNFIASFGRWTATGFPETIAAGINYSVFITDYVGLPANIGTATWTKLGDFTPTGMPLNNSANYNIVLT